MKFVHTFIVSNVIPFAIFFRAQIYANISGGFFVSKYEYTYNSIDDFAKHFFDVPFKRFFLVYQICFLICVKDTFTYGAVYK